MLTKPGDLGPKYEAGEIELKMPHLLCSLTSASQKKPISTYLLISNYNFKKKQGILLNRRETLKCVRINPTCVRKELDRNSHTVTASHIPPLPLQTGCWRGLVQVFRFGLR